MPENPTVGDFMTEVVWVVGIVIVATIGISGVKAVGRKVRNFKKA